MGENGNHDIHEFLRCGYVSTDGEKYIISAHCPQCQCSGELFCGYYCRTCGKAVNVKDSEPPPKPVAEQTYDQNRRLAHHAAAYRDD